ncbi:choice-of-anchor M domain-containing protein [Canibacter oris]|uniref:Surface-anchored protein n=1 Tax=Canibacter oris TaxID=1365628 RepID=A0A840DL89_9MICO|nr:choice-of-anchor M domain-containing protein [Canibacter oris]MBB4070858.1 surface-anchored protein [Canibacter oris]
MNLQRFKLLATTLVSTLLLALLAPFTSSANAQGGTELVDGHTDAIYVYPDSDGNPSTAIKHGLRNVLHAHDQTTIVFGADTYSDSYSFAPLGIYGKEGYYALGNTEDGPENFMHPGFAHGYSKGTDVKVTVKNIEAPGKIAVFDNPSDETAPIIPFLPGGQFFIENGTDIPIPGHKHLQWYFTHAGLYKITAYATVIGEDQAPQTSPEFTLAILIHKNESDTRAPWQVNDHDSTPDAGNNDAATPDNNDANDGSNSNDNTNSGNDGDNPATDPEIPPTDDSSPVAPSLEDVYPPNSTKTVIDSGHVDAFHLTAHNNSIKLDVLDDSNGAPVSRPAADVILAVKPEAQQDLQGTLAQLTGLQNGYFLDENGNNQDKLLFPGWDSLSLGGDYRNIEFKFDEVTGPGKVFLLKNKRLGGLTSALNNGEYEVRTGASLHQKTPAHEHGHWVFEKPGVYTMQLHATAENAQGVKVESDKVTYTWVVGLPLTANNQSPDSAAANNTASAAATTDTAGTQQPPQANLTPKPAAEIDNGCYPKVIRGAGPISLHGSLKDDRTAPAAWVNPNSISFGIGAAGKTKTSGSIGAISGGSDVWMISSTQVANVPWLGVNTQHPSLIEQAKGSSTTLSLTGFSGPGKMEVFTSGGFGNTVGQKWFSGSHNSGSGSVSLAWNSHVHPNWVFDTPGQYRVTIGMTTVLNNGKTVNGSGTLVFNVNSTAGATNGHFDFGPRVGAAGDKTVWQTKAGKPCVPTAADLAAAGMSSLAETGENGYQAAATVALLLALSSFGVMRIKRTRTAH